MIAFSDIKCEAQNGFKHYPLYNHLFNLFTKNCGGYKNYEWINSRFFAKNNVNKKLHLLMKRINDF